MEILIVFALLIINTLISAWNAWAVGRSWADAKAIGGWTRVVLYAALIMSGCGFTWVYLVVFAFFGMAFGFLETDAVQAMLQLGYVVLILPILGSGLAIWIDSVTTAYRRRDVASVGVAAWNTFAQAHNTYEAARSLPEILKGLGGFFKGGGDGKAKGQIMIVLLMILALSLGFITTYVIMRKGASSYSQSVLKEMAKSA